MLNVVIFFVHIVILSSTVLVSLFIGKEAMVTMICLQSVLANLFVLKQIVLFNLEVTTTDAYIVSAMIGLNLLQEYYGKPIARKTIAINMLALLLYTVACMIQLWYVPAVTDTMHEHFYAILSPVPRILIASFCCYLISQLVEFKLYAFFAKITQGRFLLLRNYASLSVSQLVDTLVFSFVGLYGLVHNIWHIIVFSYLVKLCIILLYGPLVEGARWVMGRAEEDK